MASSSEKPRRAISSYSGGEAGLHLGLDEGAGAAGTRADRRVLGLRLDGAEVEAGKATGADPPCPGHPHVRRDRVLGLEKEASLVLVQMTAPESVRRRAVAW